ncbi:MAG: 50S ribosomal protein L15 [Hyphomicrobiaceae bacterium]
MRLNEIKDREGARKARLRIGRGIGSGVGKTGGRGGKGQTARTGVAIGGFEGGQMPLYRRLPKRGFTPINRLRFNEVTLARLQDAIDRGRLDTSRPVDVEALKAAGLVRRALDGVRVIGTGELKAKVALKVNHATASAKAAIEQAGGSVELIVKKVLEADEQKRAKSAAKKAKTAKPKGGSAD